MTIFSVSPSVVFLLLDISIIKTMKIHITIMDQINILYNIKNLEVLSDKLNQ